MGFGQVTIRLNTWGLFNSRELLVPDDMSVLHGRAIT